MLVSFQRDRYHPNSGFLLNVTVIVCFHSMVIECASERTSLVGSPSPFTCCLTAILFLRAYAIWGRSRVVGTLFSVLLIVSIFHSTYYLVQTSRTYIPGHDNLGVHHHIDLPPYICWCVHHWRSSDRVLIPDSHPNQPCLLGFCQMAALFYLRVTSFGCAWWLCLSVKRVSVLH